VSSIGHAWWKPGARAVDAGTERGHAMAPGTHSRVFLRALSGAAIVLAAWTVTPANAAPDCRCRYQGAFFEVGRCVCMRIGGVTRRACCGKVLNNTSWSFVGNSCDLVQKDDKPRATPAPWSTAKRSVLGELGAR
jgi:hypothetical protein